MTCMPMFWLGNGKHCYHTSFLISPDKNASEARCLYSYGSALKQASLGAALTSSGSTDLALSLLFILPSVKGPKPLQSGDGQTDGQSTWPIKPHFIRKPVTYQACV